MRYLIDFKNSASQQDVDSYLSTNNCTVIKEWDNFDRVYLVEVASAPPSADIIERMTEEVGLKIKPLDIVKHDSMDQYFGCHSDPSKPKMPVSTTDNKDWWKNYSYTAPKFDTPSYELSRLGKNIDIYLMDSGIDISHPEFVDASIVNLYTVTPGDYGDTKGHGTALASVMVGKTCGITNATVKNVKIYQTGHDTLQSEFLSALDAIINDHVDGKWAILNCSWIIEKNEYIEHKLQLLDQEGVFIVAAAGNQGTSIEDVTPASMMEALTVGAYNKDLLPCDFSNYTGTSALSLTAGATNHGELDGWAPGDEIWVATLDGGYSYTAGTSIATAITSAIIASNISWFAYSDGQAHPWYSDTVGFGTNSVGNGSNYQYIFCFNKPDMLDLSDPKYAGSKNVIASMNDICVRPQSQLPDEVTLHARTGLSQPNVIGAVYIANRTKQIEWITPLPDNFQVIPDGLLLGMPSAEQGPSEGEIYKKYIATFNRTNDDDSVELVTVTIVVVGPQTTPQDIPDDADPIIKVALQAAACVGNTPMCFINSNASCGYGCSGGVPCCGIQCGKGFYDCFCAFC